MSTEVVVLDGACPHCKGRVTLRENAYTRSAVDYRCPHCSKKVKVTIDDERKKLVVEELVDIVV